MRTIISGSRDMDEADHHVLVAIAKSGFKITEVLSGCSGAVDTEGEAWALRHEKMLHKHPADWARYGKKAGPMRNEAMAKQADALIAVWDGVSRGTADMIRRARKHKLKVYVYRV